MKAYTPVVFMVAQDANAPRRLLRIWRFFTVGYLLLGFVLYFLFHDPIRDLLVMFVITWAGFTGLLALYARFGKEPPIRVSREVAADVIEAFVEDRDDCLDFEVFIDCPIADPELERLREKCRQLQVDYPSDQARTFCNPLGMELLREYGANLRNRA